LIVEQFENVKVITINSRVSFFIPTIYNNFKRGGYAYGLVFYNLLC